jgi:hypothetical protein
VCDG